MSNDTVKKGKKPSDRYVKIINTLMTKENSLTARKYRILDGYPIVGFKNRKEYDSWLLKNGGPAGMNNFSYFMMDIINSDKEWSPIFDSADYYGVYQDLYLYGKVNQETLLSVDGNDCSWRMITKDDFNNPNLKEGIYIKVGLNATIKNIKDFLKNKKENDLFRYFQSLMRSRAGLPQELIKVKKDTRKKEYMDKIMSMKNKSQEDLSKLSGMDKRIKKDVQIAEIMTKKGSKTKEGSVRKIFSRNKNSVKKL